MPPRPTDELSKIERLRIVSLTEAARLAGISKDTLRRHYQAKIIKITPGREGMRIQDALELGHAKYGKVKLVIPTKRPRGRSRKSDANAAT